MSSSSCSSEDEGIEPGGQLNKKARKELLNEIISKKQNIALEDMSLEDLEKERDNL